MRNRKGLNQRQAKFVRMILEMERTTDEIMHGLKMTMGTLTKWMKEEAFKLAWEEANLVLFRLCEAEEASCRINAARYKRKRMRKRARTEPGLSDVQVSGLAGKVEEGDGGKTASVSVSGVELYAADARGETVSVPVSEICAGRGDGGVTERERIRSLHGEEAAGAFDRLVRLREMKRAERLAGAVGKVAGEMVGRAMTGGEEARVPGGAGTRETAVEAPGGEEGREGRVGEEVGGVRSAALTCARGEGTHATSCDGL